MYLRWRICQWWKGYRPLYIFFIAFNNNRFNDAIFLPETPYFCTPADVAKLADALDLGSSGAIHVGSTPIIRTLEVDKLNG